MISPLLFCFFFSSSSSSFFLLFLVNIGANLLAFFNLVVGVAVPHGRLELATVVVSAIERLSRFARNEKEEEKEKKKEEEEKEKEKKKGGGGGIKKKRGKLRKEVLF